MNKRSVIKAVLAALQPITICVTPRCFRYSITTPRRNASSIRPILPYGVSPVSEKYVTGTPGIRDRMSLKMLTPPTPQSMIPIRDIDQVSPSRVEAGR